MATNFPGDQNKSENKTILTAEKCGNVLRGNYSPFPLVSPAFLLPLEQALSHSCHSLSRGPHVHGRHRAGRAQAGSAASRPRRLGPTSTDRDMRPVPSPWGLQGASSPSRPGAPGPARSATAPPPSAPLKQSPSPLAQDCTPALSCKKGTVWDPDRPGLEFALPRLLVGWPWKRHWSSRGLGFPTWKQKMWEPPSGGYREHQKSRISDTQPTLWRAWLTVAMLAITAVISLKTEPSSHQPLNPLTVAYCGHTGGSLGAGGIPEPLSIGQR